MSENNPNLSKYFTNDSKPSLFDQLDTDPSKTAQFDRDSSLMKQPDYIQMSHSEMKNSDNSIYNIWEKESSEYKTDGEWNKLTFPGISVSADLPDQIEDLVSSLLGEEEVNKRKKLKIDEVTIVTADDRGIRELIDNGYYRTAVNLTGRLLSIYGQGYNCAGQTTKNTPHSLQLWFTRLALLIKLGLFDLCQTEASNFGMLNRPDMFYEYYPDMYKEKRGSMVCFSFRLLLADLPQYLNKPKQSIDRLIYMNSITEQIIQHYESIAFEDAKVFWKGRQRRIFHSIINAGLMAKDYGLVDTIMNKIASDPSLNADEKYEHLSCWGRIYLQIGDVFGAEKKFVASRKFKPSVNVELTERDLIDRGLTAVAQNDFQEAYQFFQKAHLLNPNNVVILNNISVCLLYSGKLKDAIKLYESAVDRNITSTMNNEFLINLSTLYELETTDANTKKLDLLKKINLNVVDINVNLYSCLKLQNVNIQC